MKKLKTLLVLIYNWTISLFKKKEVKEIKEEKTSAPIVNWTKRPIIPVHNNRKKTKGRHIQIDPTTGRTIYHGAK